jgi:hypothetical protein
METSIDFDSWIAAYSPTDIVYHVSYDPVSGSIFKVGNQTALVGDEYTTVIDTELAEKIIEGSLPIHRCFVNPDTQEVEIAEIKSITKINDILHRVIELEHSLAERQDLKITYDRSTKVLTIELLATTHWTNDLSMLFYLTDYNDPNVVYKDITVVLADIKNTPAVYTDIVLPERFSVYTKRLFRNYVLEIL